MGTWTFHENQKNASNAVLYKVSHLLRQQVSKFSLLANCKSLYCDVFWIIMKPFSSSACAKHFRWWRSIIRKIQMLTSGIFLILLVLMINKINKHSWECQEERANNIFFYMITASHTLLNAREVIFNTVFMRTKNIFKVWALNFLPDAVCMWCRRLVWVVKIFVIFFCCKFPKWILVYPCSYFCSLFLLCFFGCVAN